MPEPIFIGLDCGTSVIKAAAFDACGRELGISGSQVVTRSPAPGRMEFDPENLWSAAVAALHGLTDKLGTGALRVASLGVTGAGNGLILTSANDQALHPGILAVDNRAADLPDLTSATRPVNGQSQWPGQTLQLLRWFQRDQPDLLRQAARIFVIKDFIKWRLTGEYVSDFSEQSKIGLLDLDSHDSSDRLLSLFGLTGLRNRLPALAPSTHTAGNLRDEAAVLCGLPRGIAVANGLADIDASALGSGASRAGHLSIVAGTWSINQLFTGTRSRRDTIFGTSLHAVPGIWEDLEASASSTANLTWFVREACRDLETQAASAGVSVYELVNQEVAAVDPCSTPVFFHPFLFGSNTDPSARAGFYGLAGWQKRSHLLAALFEGVVFSHVVHVGRLLQGGASASEVFLSGGASRSRVWSQMFADALGMPLTIPAATEVGALGAAMCAAVAVGAHSTLAAATGEMCHAARTHTPDAGLRPTYARRFETFQSITALMQPVWKTLAAALNQS